MLYSLDPYITCSDGASRGADRAGSGRCSDLCYLAAFGGGIFKKTAQRRGNACCEDGRSRYMKEDIVGRKLYIFIESSYAEKEFYDSCVY